jgi:hypothetical protein
MAAVPKSAFSFQVEDNYCTAGAGEMKIKLFIKSIY